MSPQALASKRGLRMAIFVATIFAASTLAAFSFGTPAPVQTGPAYVKFTDSSTTTTEEFYEWKTRPTRVLSDIEPIGIEIVGFQFKVWRLNVNPAQLVSELTLDYDTRRIKLEGTLALVSLERSHGVFIDVSDPLDPKVLDYLPSGSTCNWCGPGDILYKGNVSYKFWTESNRAIVRTYDTSDLTDIRLLRTQNYYYGSQSCCNQPSWPSWTSPDRWHIVVNRVVLTLDTTGSPLELPYVSDITFDTSPSLSQSWDWGAYVSGAKVFIGTYREIAAMDISDADMPIFLGSHSIGNYVETPIIRGNNLTLTNGRIWTWEEVPYTAPTNKFLNFPTTLYRAVGEYIFAYNGGSPYTGGGIYVMLRNNSAFGQFHQAYRTMELKDLVVSGSFVYTANGAAGIQKLDASRANIEAGTLPVAASVPSLSVFDDPQGIDIDEARGIILTCGGTDGIRTYNATDLTPIGNLQVPGEYVWQIRYLKDKRYAAAVLGTFLITIDVSDPANLGFISRINVNGKELRFEGNFAYVTNGATTTIVALDNPFKPYPTYSFGGASTSTVCVSGTFVSVQSNNQPSGNDDVPFVSVRDVGNAYTSPPTEFGRFAVRVPQYYGIACTDELVFVQWFNNTVTEHSVAALRSNQPDPAGIPEPRDVYQPPPPTEPPFCYKPSDALSAVVTGEKIMRFNKIFDAPCTPLLAFLTDPLRDVNIPGRYGIEGSGSVLRIWRIDIPVPLLVSEIVLSGNGIKKVKLHGNIAAVSTSYRSGVFVDITRPLAPTVIQYLPSSSSSSWPGAGDLVYLGKYSYKASITYNPWLGVYRTENLNSIQYLRFLSLTYNWDSQNSYCCSPPDIALIANGNHTLYLMDRSGADSSMSP